MDRIENSNGMLLESDRNGICFFDNNDAQAD